MQSEQDTYTKERLNILTMTKEQAHEKIIALSNELQEHNHKYYVLSEPAISDYDFDIKLKELEQLENEYPEFVDQNSPTKRKVRKC